MTPLKLREKTVETHVGNCRSFCKCRPPLRSLIDAFNSVTEVNHEISLHSTDSFCSEP